jgi:hypothetical protein
MSGRAGGEAVKREPYTPCKLYVDGLPRLAVGDYITTAGGAGYLVQAVRPSPSIPHRRYLDCVRWPTDEIPPDARRWQLHWYRRPRRRPL